MTEPILFYRRTSPWSCKVTAYLALRRISYVSCEQPAVMPRPDLAALGVAYRRVPLMSFGRDVYCDTSLILSMLEAFFPPSERHPTILPATPEARALAYLLEKWTELAVFPVAVDCIPVDNTQGEGSAYVTDRSEYLGFDWTREHRAERHAPALVAMRGFFEFMENDVLSDGRHWMLNTDRPMLADVHVAWIFEVMTHMPDALPDDAFGAEHYPRTYAWCQRYKDAIEHATEKVGIEDVGGAEARRRIVASEQDADGDQLELDVDETDPLKLKRGQIVEVAPIDTGMSGVQKGRLLGIEKDQVTLEAQTEDGEKIRVRFPRWNFRVTAV